ncbi:MAG: hypothetical protein V1725_07490 [archaeon]
MSELETMLSSFASKEGWDALVKKAVETGMDGYEAYVNTARQLYHNDAFANLTQGNYVVAALREIALTIPSVAETLRELTAEVDAQKGKGPQAAEQLYLDYYETMRACSKFMGASVQTNPAAASKWLTLTLLGNLHTTEAQTLQKNLTTMGNCIPDDISAYTFREDIHLLCDKATELDDLGFHKAKARVMHYAFLVTESALKEKKRHLKLDRNSDGRWTDVFPKLRIQVDYPFFANGSPDKVETVLHLLQEPQQKALGEMILRTYVSYPYYVAERIRDVTLQILGEKAQELPAYRLLLAQFEQHGNFGSARRVAELAKDSARMEAYAAFKT